MIEHIPIGVTDVFQSLVSVFDLIWTRSCTLKISLWDLFWLEADIPITFHIDQYMVIWGIILSIFYLLRPFLFLEVPCD